MGGNPPLPDGEDCGGLLLRGRFFPCSMHLYSTSTQSIALMQYLVTPIRRSHSRA